MAKRLVMMWDYGSPGLWEAETGYGVALEALPLPDATRRALRDWIRSIDDVKWELMEADDGRDDCVYDDPRLAQLDVAGRDLWLDLRNQLSPAYEIGYAVGPSEDDTEAPMRVLWAPDAPPEALPWGDGE